MRSNTRLIESDESTLVNLIDKLYQFINGTLSGKTFQSNAKFAWSELWDSIGKNASESFDTFASWIKGMFQNGGIFNKIGQGIVGIIKGIHSILTSIISNFPGSTNQIPGFGITVGSAIAIGLVSALTLIAFYKVFKGLLGSDKEDNYDRYSESIDKGNELVVEFYNTANHLVYNYKYGILTEGFFGGIFEFVGRTIRKGFQFVGDIIKDAYRGVKKHPMLAFFVLVICFFICFCMKNPFGVSATQLATGKTIEMPGLLSQLKTAGINKAKAIAEPFVKTGDKLSTIWSNPKAYAKTLPVLNWFLSESDVLNYINVTFDEI